METDSLENYRNAVRILFSQNKHSEAEELCWAILKKDPTCLVSRVVLEAVLKEKASTEAFNRLFERIDSLEKSVTKFFSASPEKTPVDQFIYDQERYFAYGHFHETYKEWRMRRIRKILEIYGIELDGWRILELGGGTGEIGSFLAQLGAEVVSAEGRAVNRNFANLKNRNIEGFKSVEFDGEKDFTDLGEFDLIVNFGFIEVIENIQNIIDCCCKMAPRVLVDTLVCDSSDSGQLLFHKYETDFDDHPMHNKKVARPSPNYIEKQFSNRGYKTERFFTNDLDTSNFRYAWHHENDNKLEIEPAVFLRRFWNFVKESKF